MSTRYMVTWLRGALTSGVITLLPIRLAIAIAVPVLGVLVGNWLGYPRLVVGLTIGLAVFWILVADGGLGALGYLSGANPMGALGVTLLLLAAAAASTSWIIQLDPPAAALSLSGVAQKSALFLIALDALGAYAEMRMMMLIEGPPKQASAQTADPRPLVPCILCGKEIKVTYGLNSFYNQRNGRTYALCSGGCEGKGACDDALVHALIAKRSEEQRRRSEVSS